MNKDKYGSDAYDWAYENYIKGDPRREDSFEREYRKAEMAKVIYDLRKQAHMTQERLAEIAGVEPSVIEDLEESDYSGDFFEIAQKVIDLLKRKLAYLHYKESWGKESDQRIAGMLGVDPSEVQRWREID